MYLDYILTYQAGTEVEVAGEVEILNLATVGHVGKEVAAILAVAGLQMLYKSKAPDPEVETRTLLNDKIS